MKKIYVASKDENPPDMIADGINVTKQGGITFFKDEIGWYYKIGEREVTDEDYEILQQDND